MYFVFLEYIGFVLPKQKYIVENYPTTYDLKYLITKSCDFEHSRKNIDGVANVEVLFF